MRSPRGFGSFTGGGLGGGDGSQPGGGRRFLYPVGLWNERRHHSASGYRADRSELSLPNWTGTAYADCHIILFGTLESSALLQAVQGQLPVKVTANGVAVGATRYTGPQYGAFFLNPELEEPAEVPGGEPREDSGARGDLAGVGRATRRLTRKIWRRCPAGRTMSSSARISRRAPPCRTNWSTCRTPSWPRGILTRTGGCRRFGVFEPRKARKARKTRK